MLIVLTKLPEIREDEPMNASGVRKGGVSEEHWRIPHLIGESLLSFFMWARR